MSDRDELGRVLHDWRYLDKCDKKLRSTCPGIYLDGRALITKSYKKEDSHPEIFMLFKGKMNIKYQAANDRYEIYDHTQMKYKSFYLLLPEIKAKKLSIEDDEIAPYIRIPLGYDGLDDLKLYSDVNAEAIRTRMRKRGFEPSR